MCCRETLCVLPWDCACCRGTVRVLSWDCVLPWDCACVVVGLCVLPWDCVCCRWTDCYTNPTSHSLRGFVHLGAGLAVGLSGLAAGFAIGIVGDAGVRGTAQQPRLFVGMILILIFAEVGFIFSSGGRDVGFCASSGCALVWARSGLNISDFC